MDPISPQRLSKREKGGVLFIEKTNPRTLVVPGAKKTPPMNIANLNEVDRSAQTNEGDSAA